MLRYSILLITVELLLSISLKINLQQNNLRLMLIEMLSSFKRPTTAEKAAVDNVTKTA